jgi:hypothetical protein
MKTYARIQKAVVAEIVSTAADIKTLYHPGLEFLDVTVTVPQPAVGWLYVGGAFSAPVIVPPVPQQVTAFQARAALHLMPGKVAPATLLDDVNAAVTAAAVGNPVAALAWEYATVVTRQGVLVASIGGGLGLTSAELDAVFIAAAAIVA